MTNTVPAGGPLEGRERLNEILVETLKLFFQGWRLVLGAGIPLSMVAAFAVYQLLRLGLGGYNILLVLSAVNLAVFGLFAPIWLSWAEERLEVRRWAKPFGVSFAWALLGITLILLLNAAFQIGAAIIIAEGLRWEISNLGSIVLTKALDALSFSLTGPLVAGWILVGRRLPVGGALAKSLRRQLHFLLICFFLAIIGSLCGGAVGAGMGFLFGVIGFYGLWVTLLIQTTGTIMAFTLYLTFSLFAFHRLYPELLDEPSAR